MQRNRYNGSAGQRVSGSAGGFCRLIKGASLFLLFLLLCGTASAEVVYTLSSDLYSIGVVSYGSDGTPQTGNVMEGIDASNLSLVTALSTDQGAWRALASTASYDVTDRYSSPRAYTLSLYDLDKAQTAPLGKSEEFKGYRNTYFTDKALYVTSEDYSGSSTVSDIFKLSLETLASSAKASTKGNIGWYLNTMGLIYSLYGGAPASLDFLDADLKTTKSFTYDGYYGGGYRSMVPIDDNSFALPFYSRDVQSATVADAGDGTTNTTDIGIRKISGSTETVIVSSVDVGLGADSGIWRIDEIESDMNNGLYFIVDKEGKNSSGNFAWSDSLYHWNGSKTTPVYNKEGETAELVTVDSKGNAYFRVSGSATESSSTSTFALYRCGVSATEPTKLLELTDGSRFGYNSLLDGSDNLYFTVYKSTSDPNTYRTTYTSYSLYRCGASDTTATSLYSVTDGSQIGSLIRESSTSKYVSVSGNAFQAGAGVDNVYFTVYKTTQDENYNTTYASYALYRCGASDAKAAQIHSVTDGSQISYVSQDESGNLYFRVRKSGRDMSNLYYREIVSADALYRCEASDTKPTELKSVTDGSQIGNVSVVSSDNVYFSIFKSETTVTEGDGFYTEKTTYPSYAFYHYNGADVSDAIHTFSNVASTGRLVDEKHKTLYLYATPVSGTGSTLLAFDNTNRHSPKQLKTFELAGRIGNALLYNDKVSSVIPDEPVRPNATIKSEVDLSNPPTKDGWKTFPFKVKSKDGSTEAPKETFFKVWITIISPSSNVAASLANAEVRYFCENHQFAYDANGNFIFDISKMKNLVDAKGNEVKEFPGGTCRVSLESTDGKFSARQESVELSAASIGGGSSGGGKSSSGGCDAGFGALALVLAATALLKKRSK